MSEAILMDNDLVLKTCCYDTVEELLSCVSSNSSVIYVLGSIRYVLRGAIDKSNKINQKEQVANRLHSFLDRVEQIEPNEEELLLAANFESDAQSKGVILDGGESQLLAVLILRSAKLMATGDKRAIKAIESLVNVQGYADKVNRRIACLEQIALTLVLRHGVAEIHRRVCSESAIDLTLGVCFACNSELYHCESILEGLRSYIKDLRRNAPNVLVESDDLSSMIT